MSRLPEPTVSYEFGPDEKTPVYVVCLECGHVDCLEVPDETAPPDTAAKFAVKKTCESTHDDQVWRLCRVRGYLRMPSAGMTVYFDRA